MVPATAGKLCKWMGQEDPGPFYLSTGHISEGLWSRRPEEQPGGEGAVAAAAPLRPCESSPGGLAPSCKAADYTRLRVWGPALQRLFRQGLGRVSHAPGYALSSRTSAHSQLLMNFPLWNCHASKKNVLKFMSLV